ncbi:DNA recombination protein RmuC [Aureimonas frigidaquae]|uniref:DNA recombination protein RmuC homolog n=1 Tax=Aureimonas frigidaquae TaxID=424757 RepID=A0A0P0Z020_9HYPH|nr:DNA recombination protein RmuC [Aureimonas frigidaquae]BAT27188.1 Fis family transcriptional regulator [Aureimonas frigidaquae]
MSFVDTDLLVAALAGVNLILLCWMMVRLSRQETAADSVAEALDQLDARIAETQSVVQAGLTAVREDVSLNAGHARGEGRALREEVGASLHRLGTQMMTTLDAATLRQAEALRAVTGRLDALAEGNDRRQEALRQSVEARLDSLRHENAAKLEEMRLTVDEKLQGTLEQRLGASFNTVNENLERVFRSVGEMQAIATGVGDLKRVLTNVKSRGGWGEATLGMLLEQVMTPEQYALNVEVRPHSGQRVEYAIRLPGDGTETVWLPIDAKLPTEDYERLVLASERGDAAGVDEAGKGLERAIRKAGADIAAKYVQPPHTTDFAVMFLPTEGLFAEVVRRPGLIDHLQRECRVVVTGPTTLMALLTSLRMGFRSLAIQKRSSEVWQVLAGVKSEFSRFGDVLDKVQKKLGEAQNAVDGARTRGRAMDRQLRAVEGLPEARAADRLPYATGLMDGLDDAAE